MCTHDPDHQPIPPAHAAPDRRSRVGLAALAGLALLPLGPLTPFSRTAHAADISLVRLPGPSLSLALRVTDIGPIPAAGWQAFLEYDTTRVTFVAGAYVTTQFGLPVINPITPVAPGVLNLAAGINPTIFQPPTNFDQDVAYLLFNFVGTGCEPRVRFRAAAFPPTRLSDAAGLSILPLTSDDPWNPCPADISGNGIISVQDIFDFLAFYFAGDCRADFNNVSGVSVQDIFDFLAAYFAGCP